MADLQQGRSGMICLEDLRSLMAALDAIPKRPLGQLRRRDECLISCGITAPLIESAGGRAHHICLRLLVQHHEQGRLEVPLHRDGVEVLVQVRHHPALHQ